MADEPDCRHSPLALVITEFRWDNHRYEMHHCGECGKYLKTQKIKNGTAD